LVKTLKNKQVISLVKESVHVGFLESSSEVEGGIATEPLVFNFSKLLSLFLGVINVYLEHLVEVILNELHVYWMRKLEDTL
jgi:hypothetical protein